jgi:hypothetical protein
VFANARTKSRKKRRSEVRYCEAFACSFLQGSTAVDHYVLAGHRFRQSKESHLISYVLVFVSVGEDGAVGPKKCSPQP